MRSRLAGGRCESGDFGRRVLSDGKSMFEQVDGANGDEPVSPVAIARSAAAHPRRSPPTFDLTVRTILHQVVLQQITAPQPKLVIVLFCLFVAGWLPTLFAHALM